MILWQILCDAESLFNLAVTMPLLRKMVDRPKANPPYDPENRFIYVPASCLPYHISGYTARTHEFLRALKNAGLDFAAVTRPGYPYDRPDALKDALAANTVFDGIDYLHSKGPGKDGLLLRFALAGAAKIREQAISRKAAMIHAASNHVNALPALLAARELGIPFQYEMRGIWELSRISRQPFYARTPSFRAGLALERFVALRADRLFVISEALKEHIINNWKIPKEKIELLPNCVNEDSYPEPQDPIHKNAICYAGSLVEYEGLDVLFQALAILRAKDKKITLNIVGDGEAGQNLKKLAANLRIDVRFMGRMQPEAARREVAEAALVCLPRKPHEVCRLVTPLKLIEAMAMGKALVVPDLPVFRDEAGEGACFFEPGNPRDLAAKLEYLLDNEGEIRQRGRLLRQRCMETRVWSKFINNVFPQESRP